MKYQIVKVIREVNEFEDACVLAGLDRQPAFDELPGELFWSHHKQIGIFAVPEEGDDLTPAVMRPISNCLYGNPNDGCCQHPGNITPECHVDACPYFDSHGKPRFQSDDFTNDDAEELAQASLDAANLFLEEMGENNNAQP